MPLTINRRRPRSNSNIESNWVEVESSEYALDRTMSPLALGPDGGAGADFSLQDEIAPNTNRNSSSSTSSTVREPVPRLEIESRPETAHTDRGGELRSHNASSWIAVVWANRIASAIASTPPCQVQDHNEVDASRISWQMVSPMSDRSSRGEFNYVISTSQDGSVISSPCDEANTPTQAELPGLQSRPAEPSSPLSSEGTIDSPMSSCFDPPTSNTIWEYAINYPELLNMRTLDTILEDEDHQSVYNRADEDQSSPPLSACSETSQCTFYTARVVLDSPSVHPRLSLCVPR
ncbi:hypothetical protein FRC12_025136 [Ceratobasidium sp. 428]|nr:hypothetical protein FRC12_025136 [Ceratobasidium sp. 428]